MPCKWIQDHLGTARPPPSRCHGWSHEDRTRAINIICVIILSRHLLGIFHNHVKGLAADGAAVLAIGLMLHLQGVLKDLLPSSSLTGPKTCPELVPPKTTRLCSGMCLCGIECMAARELVETGKATHAGPAAIGKDLVQDQVGHCSCYELCLAHRRVPAFAYCAETDRMVDCMTCVAAAQLDTHIDDRDLV